MKCGRNFNLLTSTHTPGDRFARLPRGNYTSNIAGLGLPLLFFRLFSSGIYLFIFIFVVVPDPRRNSIIRTYTHTYYSTTHTHMVFVSLRFRRGLSTPHFTSHTSIERRRHQIHALWDPQTSRVRKQSKYTSS